MARRFARSPWRRNVALVVTLILVAYRIWTEQQTPEFPLPGPRAQQGGISSGEYEVLRVVDGDTLLLKEKRTRVRLQGIDTPETVKENTAVQQWGPEASAYTKKFVREAGNRVRLQFDGESIDQYGRSLAFVWHDGRLLNEELVRQGLARAKLAYDYSSGMKSRLRRAQENAKKARRGIWSQ